MNDKRRQRGATKGKLCVRGGGGATWRARIRDVWIEANNGSGAVGNSMRAQRLRASFDGDDGETMPG